MREFSKILYLFNSVLCWMCYGSIFLYFAQPSWSGSELWCVGDVDSGASLSSWLQPPQLWGPGQIMKSSCACDFSSLKVGVIVVLTNGVIRRVQWKAHVNVSREPSSVAGPASVSCWGHRYYCRWNSPSLQPGLWPLPCHAGPSSCLVLLSGRLHHLHVLGKNHPCF